MRAFVFSLLRFQDISNSKNSTLIGGTSGNDLIHNIKGNKVTLEGGNGNDTITTKEPMITATTFWCWVTRATIPFPIITARI